MKKMVRWIAAAGLMLAAATGTAAVLPLVGNGTSPNVWTRNISGVLNAAKQTNLPILLVMINDSSTGEGCQHCMQFVNRTLNTENFANVVASYDFYMVLLNDYGNTSGLCQPEYGCVSSDVFDRYFYQYNAGDSGYPQVSVIRPDGVMHAVWSYKTTPVSTSGTLTYQYIAAAIAELSPSKTEFSLSPQSGNVVVVNADPSAPAMTPGVWTGVVTRSGGSKKTGSVSISLSGDNASRYTVEPSSFDWDSSDGSKTFTVTGPAGMDGSIVTDTLTVSIAASGFSGGEIAYGTTSHTVTFKDSRVKSTLAEFATSNYGLAGLSSSGTWFAPAQDDGNVLETITSTEATLVFTATAGGILTVEPTDTQEGSISAVDSLGEVLLVAGEPERFGVAPGQTVKFTAAAVPGIADAKVGFKQLSFTPLTVSLNNPANGAQISYGDLQANASLVDLAWSSSMPGSTFTLVFNGSQRDMGSETSANAVDLGFMTLSPVSATYNWSVNASYTEDGVRGAVVSSASSAFSVVALPVFGSVPSQVVAYKSVGSWIDMSVDSTGGSTVTYSASGLPVGMKINKTTGIITGSPKKVRNQTVTVTAMNATGSTSTTFTLSVAKMPKAITSAKYAAFLFDDADGIVASAQFTVSTTGKWTARILRNGRKSTVKGSVIVLEDGSMTTGSAAFDLLYSAASGIWSGHASGYRVFAKDRTKAGADWKGTWNMGISSSSNSDLGGWAVVNVKGTGDLTMSGLVANNMKLSGSCYSTVFPEWFVAAYLPRWAGHGDVRFGHASAKNGLGIGCALFADGTLDGTVSLNSQVFDRVEGSRWAKALLAGMNGLTLSTVGGGDVSFPVVANGTKLSAGDNAFAAKVGCTAKKGKVTLKYKVGTTTYKATGVAYVANGVSKAAGCGLQGTSKFLFTIE